MAICGIVGLGNPEIRYQNTRHNIGHRIVDLLAEKWGARYQSWPFVAEWAECPLHFLNSKGVLLLAKPLTYMNQSGDSVLQLMRKLECSAEKILIAADDFSLPLGQIRIRRGGSSGGHNGLASIIDKLQTEDFPRLRVGIGPVPNGMDPADFVLSQFAAGEKSIVKETLERVCEAIQLILERGLEAAMSQYNTKTIPS